MNKVKDFFEHWAATISLSDKIKAYLRNEIKYGTSCPYCGLPGDTHAECRKDI